MSPFSNRIPEIFQSEDTIYHYCRLNTALENILFEKKLRLSPRKDSLDPIENLKPWVSVGGIFNVDDDLSTTPEENEFTSRLKTEIINRLTPTKQVCFCMNDTSGDFNQHMTKPYEFYGFLKPRMWNQYADNYQGVCLAFSLKKLKELSTFSNNKVKYWNYSRLSSNYRSIDLNALRSEGFEKYEKTALSKLEDLLYRKHQDYYGENEYRFCSFSENEYDYLDISNCLVGIITSKNYTSEFGQNALSVYADDLKVEMISLRWSNSGISISTKSEMDKLKEKIQEEISR